MPTSAEQDYLKAVFSLSSLQPRVTVGDVANRLRISHASASSMIKKLVRAGLIHHEPFRNVQLKSAGEREALRVVRRHRLLETFLVEVLKLKWDEVHEEAEVLEHVLSERLEERIAVFLGNPARDPHGDPIPGLEGDHVERGDWPLSHVSPGTSVRIERVSDRSSEILRHLATEGLKPGIVVTVDHRDPFGGPLWVSSTTSKHALGPELVDSISVSILSKEMNQSDLEP